MMKAMDLSRRLGVPCDPRTWPAESVRNHALMSMPGWEQGPEYGKREDESSLPGGEEQMPGHYVYQQGERRSDVFNLEAALEASAAKQAAKKKGKKKKGKGKQKDA